MISDPFIPGQIYRRSNIHSDYGGNMQSGICPSSRFPFIFIFSGSSGEQHGYKDMWENANVFAYSGEGQLGNMKFDRGNLALRDHIKNGKRVFLFEFVRKGYVKFVCELEFHSYGEFMTNDREGKQRIGIKFFMQRKGAVLTYDLNKLATFDEPFENINLPNITERAGLVFSRVGQGAYRKSIINRWENQCAVTGFQDSRILIASHIHPWRDSNDEQRLDINNGILLSPTYDALFDKHLITFEDTGRIVLSSEIDTTAFQRIGVTGIEKIKRLNSDNLFYLKKHQEKFQTPT